MRRDRRFQSEAGQGLIPTLFGFGVVLVLLLFATQVVFDLYARSAVTSAAVEAARSVAGYASSRTYDGAATGGADPAEQAAIGQAEDRARAALGKYGDVVGFEWRLLPSADAPTEVELRVHFDVSGSGFDLARPLALPFLNRFDRTVRVRIERIVCPAPSRCSLVEGTAVPGPA